MSLPKLLAMLKKHPIVPSMVSFSLLFPGANLIQQTCFKKHESRSVMVDWGEVGRFSLYGGLIHGPLIHNWVNFLSRRIPQTTLPYVMVKVMIDQLCFAPIMLSTFLVILTAAEGKTAEETMTQWREKFLPTYATGACVWPILLAVNYKIVPLFLRSTYLAICNFFWIIFLAKQRSRTVPWQSPLLKLL